MKKLFLTPVLMVLMAAPLFAQERFSSLVGDVQKKPAVQENPVLVKTITWGADAAVYYANGGVTTAKGSIYDKLGLNIKLQNQDDFVQQTRDYIGGQPFVRGTMRMMGMASEVFGENSLSPVIITQLSFSKGDHLVAVKEIRTLNDLVPKDGKKVKIICQQGGPHPGLLFDSFKYVKKEDGSSLTIDDVEMVWVQDLTGPNGPAQALRDGKGDVACVITPDMLGLCGDFDSVGSGAEGTVAGVHVINSTQQMVRSIADVWGVRPDWYAVPENKVFVEKFVAGYLKATEEVVKLRKGFEDTGTMSPAYKQLLTTIQTVFGKEVIPSIEVDGHGLLLDCAFAGLPGQVAFYEDLNNLNGFASKTETALEMATAWGYAENKHKFANPKFDYAKLARIGGIDYTAPTKQSNIKAESVNVFPDSDLEGDNRVIVSFSITFEPNQTDFPVTQYKSQFDEVIQAESDFKNCVLVVRGHSDPTQTLVDFLKAGMGKRIIKRSGQRGNYRYTLEGAALDLNNTKRIIGLIQAGKFDGVNPSPRETMTAALTLSQNRADEVKDTIIEYAAGRSEKPVELDANKFNTVAAGISSPVIAKPRNFADTAKNRRVEFMVVKVPGEAIEETDFDF